MNIGLTPELERAVHDKVDSGLYHDADEVVREALRLLLKRDAENDWLRREAAIGFAQLEAGDVERVHDKSQFLALARDAS